MEFNSRKRVHIPFNFHTLAFISPRISYFPFSVCLPFRGVGYRESKRSLPRSLSISIILHDPRGAVLCISENPPEMLAGFSRPQKEVIDVYLLQHHQFSFWLSSNDTILNSRSIPRSQFKSHFWNEEEREAKMTCQVWQAFTPTEVYTYWSELSNSSISIGHIFQIRKICFIFD